MLPFPPGEEDRETLRRSGSLRLGLHDGNHTAPLVPYFGDPDCKCSGLPLICLIMSNFGPGRQAQLVNVACFHLVFRRRISALTHTIHLSLMCLANTYLASTSNPCKGV